MGEKEHQIWEGKNPKNLDTLPMDQKDGTSEYVSRNVFFSQKKSMQLVRTPAMLVGKEHFDIANNCGDSDLVMVSPICVSVIPRWPRLCIEAKEDETIIHNLGSSIKNMTKKHQSKFHNELWEKQTRTGPQPPHSDSLFAVGS